MENKKFYLSKTFWVNILAIAAMVAQSLSGKEILNMEAQASILAGINIVLRFLTKSPVVW